MICVATTSRSRVRGFTLVELLASISIIVILAAMVLVGLAGVQKTAREHRTRAQILRLHTLISERMESYETRRMPIDTTGLPAETASLLQLAAKRELMRLELPERITDVVDDPLILTSIPALTRSYRARVKGLANPQWSIQFQEAECLYLIMSRIYVDETNGLEFFAEGEIGDTDDDGMPEILDAWGMPIRFLRWAPGFGTLPVTPGMPQNGISVMQDDGRRRNGVVFDTNSWTPDRWDVMQVDTYPRPSHTSDVLRPFDLVPLIFSAGPDKKYNIATTVANQTSGGALDIYDIHYGVPQDVTALDFPAELTGKKIIARNEFELGGRKYELLDPFFVFVLKNPSERDREFRIGEVADHKSNDHQDNIHNHFTETR